MNTNRLFKSNVYLKEADAVVTSVSEAPKKYPSCLALTLDQTIFFPTGGGQPCDLGRIGGYKVLDVYEEDSSGAIDIFHIIDPASFIASPDDPISPISTPPMPKPGDTLHLELDWERRFDNMQRHCGEHILSGVFYELYGGVNRGFHMGDDYLTIDISLEENPAFKEVTWEMAKEAEYKTNQIIWQNLPIVAHHFDTKEEAEKIPMRKKLAIEEDITIVTVGDPSNPADSVACCGTHPSTSSQVGMLKIYKVEPNKGMFRIFFEAGERAFRNYEKSYDVLGYLEKDLSAGSADLIAKYQARQEKQAEIRDRLYRLTKEVISREIDSIDNDISLLEKEENRKELYFERSFDIITVEDVIEIGRGLTGRLPKVLFLLHKNSSTLLLFSDEHDCGKLVKDNVHVFNGKGGGSKEFARAIFKDNQDAQLFTTAIKTLI